MAEFAHAANEDPDHDEVPSQAEQLAEMDAGAAATYDQGDATISPDPKIKPSRNAGPADRNERDIIVRGAGRQPGGGSARTRSETGPSRG